MEQELRKLFRLCSLKEDHSHHTQSPHAVDSKKNDSREGNSRERKH